jgi:pantetheine-phosphate adenylyltransferase
LTIAVYPGSFDPITNGHMDIVRRALALFDKLIVAVYEKPSKRLLFSLEERVDMVRKAVAGMSNVSVQSYDCLTVDFIHQVKGKAMIRGLRMNSDFEQEFEMALMNKKLAPDIELVCLMADSGYQFLSSSSIKEVAKLGGCVEGMVPEHVANALGEKFFLRATKSSILERR